MQFYRSRSDMVPNGNFRKVWDQCQWTFLAIELWNESTANRPCPENKKFMIIGKSDCSGRSFRFYSSSSFLSCKTCLAFDGDTTNARFPLESFAGHVVHTMLRTAFSCTSGKRKNPCKCFIYKDFRFFLSWCLAVRRGLELPTHCFDFQGPFCEAHFGTPNWPLPVCVVFHKPFGLFSKTKVWKFLLMCKFSKNNSNPVITYRADSWRHWNILLSD